MVCVAQAGLELVNPRPQHPEQWEVIGLHPQADLSPLWVMAQWPWQTGALERVLSGTTAATLMVPSPCICRRLGKLFG